MFGVAGAIVIQRPVRVEVDGVVMQALELFVERLEYEDDCYQHGKALLCEPGDEANQGAEVERHHDEQEETHPEADPESELQVVPLVVTGS